MFKINAASKLFRTNVFSAPPRGMPPEGGKRVGAVRLGAGDREARIVCVLIEGPDRVVDEGAERLDVDVDVDINFDIDVDSNLNNASTSSTSTWKPMSTLTST